MTGQIPDSVQYRGHSYSLTGQEGEGLFDPADHGIQPAVMSTACWRGFICEYTVVDGGLVLTELQLSVEGDPPTLFGVAPERDELRDLIYRNLREPVRFTGRLLLGREFIDGLYVHMGFQSSWKYQDVQELEFENGHLTAVHDRSAEAAQRRAAPDPADAPPAHTDSEAVQDWIKKTFSQDIDL
ncbi:hypothetical protein [Actinomadura rupiterrae]|uniref:hypothetical protein n=1 Tax=Actinomadura rupiterrae TaxID=559627 RepID=UPI0020A41943|nr:hypothetical protein [Actinomadura rupiterrae]MCP2341236.1 hypothetical protein [Actinomadura rupiterrae]